MRITCPLCGPRDRREFYYYGADDYLVSPRMPKPLWREWDDYLHLRDNPAGVTRDLWYHETGCASWLAVTRNTVTHEILSTELVADSQERGREMRIEGKGLIDRSAPVRFPL